MTGTHTHDHAAHGHWDHDDGIHSHEHSHDGEAMHDHEHGEAHVHMSPTYGRLNESGLGPVERNHLKNLQLTEHEQRRGGSL
jgi:hypothetical protein